uniref:Death domain-containing protein n=2 Tax=Amphimedon queenslandica TaxID=400682 RepID=A0A1X7TFU5_AMPQE
MLLLLSGDVECNPGPTIDDRPDISLLIQWLEPLVPWKQFGSCLVEMKEHDILKIEQENIHLQTEHKKFALYSKWLSVNPKATWRDIIDALENIKENTIVQDIKNYMDSDAASTVSSLSPRISNSDGDIEIIFFSKEEQKVQDSLDELQAKFSHIMTEIKSVIRMKVTNNNELPTKISNWVESHLHLEPGTVHNDLDDIFKKMYLYYDFSDCSLIVAMCDEFISNEKDLLDELKAYSFKS